MGSAPAIWREDFVDAISGGCDGPPSAAIFANFFMSAHIATLSLRQTIALESRFATQLDVCSSPPATFLCAG